MSRASSRRWMTAALGAALLAGFGAGVVVDRLVLVPRTAPVVGREAGDGHRHRERLSARLERELALTEEQKAELARILERNRERAHAFWAKARGEFTRLREEFRAEIRRILTPEQRARFDELVREDDAEREERRRGH